MSTNNFTFGQLVSTPGALDAFRRNGEEPWPYLARHADGDWGDLDEDDMRFNNAALRHGERLLSAYTLPDGTRIYIISEADRSSTFILLPVEY